MWQYFHVYASFTSDNLTYFSKLNPKSSYSQVQLHERWHSKDDFWYSKRGRGTMNILSCLLALSIAPSSVEVDYQVPIVGQVSSLINTIFYTILCGNISFFFFSDIFVYMGRSFWPIWRSSLKLFMNVNCLSNYPNVLLDRFR